MKLKKAFLGAPLAGGLASAAYAAVAAGDGTISARLDTKVVLNVSKPAGTTRVYCFDAPGFEARNAIVTPDLASGAGSGGLAPVPPWGVSRSRRVHRPPTCRCTPRSRRPPLLRRVRGFYIAFS
jgi:hypothetical protein